MRRWSALVLACCVTAFACHRGGGDEGDTSGANANVTVGTAVAAVRPFTVTVDAIGSVNPRPGRFAELSAPAPTRVAKIYVAAGDRVVEGAPLVEFETAPFTAAAASAEAVLTSAQAAADRAQRLAQAGIIPRKEADQAAADLAQAQAAAVTARRNAELAVLRAPLSGVVTRMTAVLGAPVDAGSAVVAVADPSALDVVLSVTPAEAARIARGDSVAVSAGESAAAAESLGTAVVADVGAAVDSASRGVSVRARFSRPARALRIGETVFGRITVAVHPRAVAVPVAALVPDENGFHVFVVGADGRAHIRPVTVGARSEQLAEILSGLAAGETVVTTGAYGVADSAQVHPPAP